MENNGIDFKGEQEKLNRLTYVTPDESVKKTITKSNSKMALMSGAIWAIALYLVSSYALSSEGTARMLLFGIDAVIVVIAILSFIPHKVQIHEEELEIKDLRKLGKGDAGTWVGTVYVPEIDDTITAPLFYPATTPNKNKNEAPVDEGTRVKIIIVGKGYYVAPVNYLEGKTIY